MLRPVLLACLALACGQAGAAARLELPRPDIESALRTDASGATPQPYRFAVAIPLHVTPATHGRWDAAADGRLRWSLHIAAAGAGSLNFAFTRYRMPEGGTLVVRGAGGGDPRGPYTARQNARGQVWTPVVRGGEALLELTVPAAAQSDLVLELTQVAYGFRGFGAKDDTGAKSGDCNVDVVCPAGDEWRDEIRAAARYTINGLFLCSGQLVNNTKQDFTPYFLTAAHCLSTPPEALGTVFYWNYETGTCGGRPDGKLDQTIEGAELVASSKGLSLAAPDLGPDFTLLRLSEMPPADFKVYYAGWDNRDVAPRGVTGIHHPSGDEKRISFDYDQTQIAAYGEEPDSDLSAIKPTHIRIVDWDLGTTEGGSSGSGIWNTEHRLVGQLSGGSAACGNNSSDWYGRFHKDWFDLQTPPTSVASHLDPDDSGVEFLDGADPNGIRLNPPPKSGDGFFAGGLGAALLGGLLAAAGWRRLRRAPA
ncbi:MAG: trypsin-like peptidase domain-containing protein [Gammaproteobacteria bacterium]|nr:trypsin-like peptidase domain-containing protein [Gammaproteobacteria bacterium]